MTLKEFLIAISQNNNRQWFQEHRSEFDVLQQQWYDDLQRLINAMSAWEPRLKRLSPKDASYRFYRDTRFSADKTPYKTYFSASVSPFRKIAHRAGYYIQIDPNPADNGLYGGLWMPDAAMLRKLRKVIVDNIEEFDEIINAPDIQRLYPAWLGETLKTVPKGWDKTHPQAHLLRLKQYGKGLKLPFSFFEDPQWPDQASELLRPLKPLVDFLNYSIDEE